MTEDAVARALRTVVNQAFNAGRSPQLGRDGVERSRQDAETYAEQLIMPMVTAAIEQGREEGFAVGRAERVEQVA